MEILNTITHEAGSIDFGMLAMAILCTVAAIAFIAIAILAFSDWAYGCGILAICVALVFALIGIGCWCNIKEKTTWHEYDVMFTEPIDIDKFNEKYEIKSQNGKIYHIEERH